MASSSKEARSTNVRHHIDLETIILVVRNSSGAECDNTRLSEFKVTDSEKPRLTSMEQIDFPKLLAYLEGLMVCGKPTKSDNEYIPVATDIFYVHIWGKSSGQRSFRNVLHKHHWKAVMADMLSASRNGLGAGTAANPQFNVYIVPKGSKPFESAKRTFTSL